MSKSAFQRQLDKDFLTTFLNLDEFGRECDWNGGVLRIVEGVPDAAMSGDSLGILSGTKRIYCRSKDLLRLPEPEDKVYLDGDRWEVLDAYEAPGYYAITLERPKSQ